jgi:hypothetical protein
LELCPEEEIFALILTLLDKSDEEVEDVENDSKIGKFKIWVGLQLILKR